MPLQKKLKGKSVPKKGFGKHKNEPLENKALQALNKSLAQLVAGHKSSMAAPNGQGGPPPAFQLRQLANLIVKEFDQQELHTDDEAEIFQNLKPHLAALWAVVMKFKRDEEQYGPLAPVVQLRQLAGHIVDEYDRLNWPAKEGAAIYHRLKPHLDALWAVAVKMEQNGREI